MLQQRFLHFQAQLWSHETGCFPFIYKYLTRPLSYRYKSSVFFQNLWYSGSPGISHHSDGFQWYNIGCVGGKIWTQSMFSITNLKWYFIQEQKDLFHPYEISPDPEHSGNKKQLQDWSSLFRPQCSCLCLPANTYFLNTVAEAMCGLYWRADHLFKAEVVNITFTQNYTSTGLPTRSNMCVGTPLIIW